MTCCAVLRNGRSAPPAAPAALVNADFVEFPALSPLTPNARLATPGANVVITDGGPGGTATISVPTVPSTSIVPVVLADVNFAALPSQNFADGVVSINGVNWTCANRATADTWGINLGTGLEFNAAASSTGFSNAAQSCALIYVPMTTLVPTWDAMSTLLIELAIASATLGTTPNAIQCGIWNPGFGGTVVMTVVRRNSSGTQQSGSLRNQGNETAGVSASNSAIAMKLNPLGAAAFVGTYAAAFPSPYPNASSVYNASTASPSVSAIWFDRATSRLVIAMPTGEAGGNMAATVNRLRVSQLVS